ncbi:MAG: protein translocase SEC61 complex subunit gamma [Candidatus Aenigmatarchaeota archaeon]
MVSDKAGDMASKIKPLLSGGRVKLKSFVKQCRRILTIATKPGKTEYFGLSKVVAAGVLLLGVVGFILYLVFYAIKSLFPV